MTPEYLRNVAVVTDVPVSLPADEPARRFRRGKKRGPDAPSELDLRAHAEAKEVVAALAGCAEALQASIGALSALKRPKLLGKVEDDQAQAKKAAAWLNEARDAIMSGDLGGCGGLVKEANQALSSIGGMLTLALNQELAQAAVPRAAKAAVIANVEARQQAKQVVAAAKLQSPRAAVLATVPLLYLLAEGLKLAAQVLELQPAAAPTRPQSATSGAEVRVVSPDELETFDDVGGLEEAKQHLRRTVGLMLERSGEAARSGMLHNGVLLHGPPGTGKTLLGRATAGEYGLRFIRFSPSMIASAYQHQPAKMLQQVFATAAEAAPCLLFLDEVDTLGARREGGSADQRELATQLFVSLEEYRGVPGLVIMAATNALDQLDPALREGRFDSRIAIPLPDAEARQEILEVQLRSRDLAVAWETLDMAELAQLTSGRSGAALASIVTGASGRALARDGAVTQADLVAEIAGRSGQDRAQVVEEQVLWEDVVLPEATRQRISEVLLVFQRPELGRSLGVRPPAGILLHGPPGTGKTTIAKALASEVKASFYNHSAADLLGKFLGESEQNVAQLFARARANRPSIIFIDEIDTVLKRRTGNTDAPWEDRMVSQFLAELDGLSSGEGVLLVGSTNRLDIIDDAVRQRRLMPVEVPLPDAAGRRKLLEVLCRNVRVSPDVDLQRIAAATPGMSGSDLKELRNSAGMKALTRAVSQGQTEAAVGIEDFKAALAERTYDPS